MSKYIGQAFGRHLIAEGLCPPNCREVELHIPASGVVVLRYEVFVDTADLGKIQRALAALEAEQSKVETP